LVLQYILLTSLLFQTIWYNFVKFQARFSRKNLRTSVIPKSAGTISENWTEDLPIRRPLYLVAVLLLNSLHTHESIRQIFGDLLYLSFLLETNMNFRGKPKPFSPAATSQAALPQRQSERVDPARITALRDAGQRYFDQMPQPRKNSVQTTLANILLCKPGAEGMAQVVYAVGSTSEKLANIRRRSDNCLQSGQTFDMIIDGLPGEFTTSARRILY